MKNARFVASVKVVRVSGKFEYHIPSTMTGAAFTQWQKDNQAEIDAAKDALSDQDAEGDTSTGGRAAQ